MAYFFMQQTTGPIGQLNRNKQNITIIGSGISGLLMAYYLEKSGYIVTIVEKSFQIGGKISTVETEYGPCETAANAIFTNDDVYELLNDLNITYYKAPTNLRKNIWRKHGLRPMLKCSEIFRIFLSSFKKINQTNLSEQSVFDFFSPLVGEKVCNEIISAGLGGIYAEPAQTIHFKSLFHSPFKAKRYIGFIFEMFSKKRSMNKTKATSIGFDGGMKTFINHLRSNLKAQFILGKDCTSLELTHNTIICTDAIEASMILKDVSKKASSLLQKIRYNSLVTSTVFTNRPISFLEGSFGVLFPPASEIKFQGVLHNSSIFPNRTNDKNNRSYTVIQKSKEDLKTDFLKIDSTLNLSNIIHIQQTPWAKAIPIYDNDRYKSILALRSLFIEIDPGLLIFGNYVDGISIREMLSNAKNFSFKNSYIHLK